MSRPFVLQLLGPTLALAVATASPALAQPADPAPPPEAPAPAEAPQAPPAAERPQPGAQPAAEPEPAAKQPSGRRLPFAEPVTAGYGLVFGFGLGGSLNIDQWLAHARTRLDGFCVGACSRDLGLSLHFVAGFGGNHVTLRGSLRLEYVLWFTQARRYGFFLATGGSIYGHLPVGHFASWCSRVDLEGCAGFGGGFELGGGFRLPWVTLEGMGGVGAIPTATLVVSVDFDVWDSED